ncbi:Mu transposase C-terminal domain-containing protein [Nakamurella endophytica]|uniref:Transposase n=1 Tax=Nakamurella endophytica TaxID=1748367 RepID=A0A917WMU6_9ACTN|nr:Mu transposase C-terminal domain-containing protein [Nakamurella endophytica]GGM17180.1 transposase [Nakamurella endophytica]
MAELEQRLAVLSPHVYDGVPLSVVARQAGVPLRTARRWLAAYRAAGAVGLSRVGRADRGGRRLPAELVQLVEGLALRRPPPRIAEVHRRVVEIANERALTPPSYQSVRRIVQGLDRGLLSLAHRGPDSYRDDFELVLRREAAHANDIWQADHTQLDVMVLDESGSPARPWLTAIVDDQSRAVAGYTVFLGEPTAVQTALALRQAIWRKTDPQWPVCGIPATLYADHGANFTSAHIARVCADLKVQLIHSTPGNPRGRGKGERFFGTVTTELLPTVPGHIPPGNHGKPVTTPTYTLSQLDSAVGAWITGTYHQRTHPETGQTPVQRWSAGEWLPRMPDSIEQLDLLLLTVATPRKIQRDGIHLHGLRYFSLTLAAYVGEPVTIRYDPRDLAEIRVYHQDQFLCRAVAPDIAAASISMQDLQAARNQRRRELRQHLSARRSLVDLLAHPATASPAASAESVRAASRSSEPVEAEPPLKLYREN